ncbi:MAG: glutamine synthetase beta-grasp domain-containing protein, partial [Glutamicibacter sp.]
MDRQQEFVLRTIEERDVRFVRMWFTDVVGSLKSVALAPAEVEDAFEEGLGFDGSSIDGLSRISESDMLLQPDPATFQILPWRGEVEPTSRMFCDILTPEGQPSNADPRQVLKRQLAEASNMGFTCYTHPEIEFYLLENDQLDANGRPQPIDNGGYFDHVPDGVGQDFRRASVTTLEALGIS